MSVLNNSIVPAGAGDTGYTIDQSLRFNDDDSAYLSRTPSSAGNQKTWTFSCWFKRGNLDINNFPLLSAVGDTQYYDAIRINGNPEETFSIILGGSGDYTTTIGGTYLTGRLFRDVSSWYHVVVAMDTAQGTESDRCKIWINGEQQTLTDIPAQNYNCGINKNVAHYLGKITSYTEYADGGIAEVNFIDGQAKNQFDFGETDEDYGHWKPIEYTGTYGTNGFYLPFSNTATKHTITAYDNVQHSTAQSKVGGSSIAFDGTTDRLTVPADSTFAFGSGDFTVETWVRFSSLASQVGIFGNYATSGAGYSGNYALQRNTNGDVYWYYGNGQKYTLSSPWNPSTNTWYHVAMCRSGTNLRFFVDGTQLGSTVTDSVSYASSAPFTVGAYRDNSEGSQLNGYIDEVRVSKTARYTTTFTPSTTAFTEDDNTLLLIHSDTTNGSTVFTDSSGVEAGLGNDLSGEENHWTTNNLAATDVLLDSPTNNFATLNPLMKSAYITLSEGNLRADWSATDNGGSFSTMELVDGSYFEAYVLGTSADYPKLGVTTLNNYANTAKFNSGGMVSSDGATPAIWSATGVTLNGTPSASSYTTADVLQVAYKNGKVYIGKNNVWMNSGSPTGGTGQVFDIAAGTKLDITYAVYSAGELIFNFGQDSSFAGNKTAQSNTDDNGYGDFYYSPPTDYLALCTQNLDDPAVTPSEHFDVVTWTGNDSVQHITGLDFQPDLVWAKDRSATRRSNLIDVVRGTQARLYSSDTEAEAPNSGLSSFNSDGFSLTGGYSDTNHLNETFVAWCWKANGSDVLNENGTLDSQVSANQDAGFSIVSYTGTGSNATVGHGLDDVPELVLFKNRSISQDWAVYNDTIGATHTMRINETDGAYVSGRFQNTDPTSSVIYVSTQTVVNGNGNNMIAYCFHSVEGYSKIGWYHGGGTADDAVFVYTGFKPAYLMLKAINRTAPWVIYDVARDTHNQMTNHLEADTNLAEQTDLAIDFLSNGFKPKSAAGDINTADGEYIYLAFAETPFKYTNAR